MHEAHLTASTFTDARACARSPAGRAIRCELTLPANQGSTSQLPGRRGTIAMSANAEGSIGRAADSRADLVSEKYAKIVRASPLAIGVTEARSGIVLEVNAAFERTFKASREQVPGTNMTRLAWPRGSRAHASHLLGAGMSAGLRGARAGSDLRVIVMSGYSPTWNADSVKALGVVDLLVKPLSVHTLASSLRRIFEGSRAE